MKLLIPLVVAAAVVVVAAKVKIDIQHDPSFDFRAVHTYAWHPDGAGEVKVLVKHGGDPETLRRRFGPVIEPAIEQELLKKGLAPVQNGIADLHIYYYLLLSAGDSSQYIGQFLSPTPEWGVPPFAAATQSLKIYEQGSLILDFSSPAQKQAVWRGVAKAEVDRQRSDEARDRRIRDAIREMVGKYPPKSKR